MSEKRKPLWPWIVTLPIAMPVLYVASFGPACWMTSRTNVGVATVAVVYRPIAWSMAHNYRVAKALNCYAEFGAAREWRWVDFSDSAINPDNFVWMRLKIAPYALGGDPSVDPHSK